MSTDILFRATSRVAFDQLAILWGLIDAHGESLRGVNIDVIEKGEFVIKPPVYDRDGEVVTPALVDNDNVYVNVRLVPPAEPLAGNVARWMQTNAPEQDRQSRYPGGPTRRRRVAADGAALVELISAPPQFPRRIWLGDEAP